MCINFNSLTLRFLIAPFAKCQTLYYINIGIICIKIYVLTYLKKLSYLFNRDLYCSLVPYQDFAYPFSNTQLYFPPRVSRMRKTLRPSKQDNQSSLCCDWLHRYRLYVFAENKSHGGCEFSH